MVVFGPKRSESDPPELKSIWPGWADALSALGAEQSAFQCFGGCRLFRAPAVDEKSFVVVSANAELAMSVIADNVQIWQMQSGRLIRTLPDLGAIVTGLLLDSVGNRAVIALADKTLFVFALVTGNRLQEFKGHSSPVTCLSAGEDGIDIFSGHEDGSIRRWQPDSGTCTWAHLAHTGQVRAIACHGQCIVSGGEDQTVRLWDAGGDECLLVLAEHRASVTDVAFSSDGDYILSAANDETLTLWRWQDGRCLGRYPEKTNFISNFAFTADAQAVQLTAWEGIVVTWDVRDHIAAKDSALDNDGDCTKAKVLVIGEPGSGKTGLVRWLANMPKCTTESTIGVQVTRMYAPDLYGQVGGKREVMLWDFGGQLDQRSVHLLHMKNCAMLVLMFNAESEDDCILSGLTEWLDTVQPIVPSGTPMLLVAGRVDCNAELDRKAIGKFAKERGFEHYYLTSGWTGQGCAELRDVISNQIPWEKVQWHERATFVRAIQNGIAQLRNGAQKLCSLETLHSALVDQLPDVEISAELLCQTVELLVAMNDIAEIRGGVYYLLQTEYLDSYAQAVFFSARADPLQLGRLAMSRIIHGELDFCALGRDGKTTQPIQRLPAPQDEQNLLIGLGLYLQAQKLCFQQRQYWVFPEFCQRESGDLADCGHLVVTYHAKGYLTYVYATLIVELVESNSFRFVENWRDAAAFAAKFNAGKMGVTLLRGQGNQGQFCIHFAPEVGLETRHLFMNQIHSHLVAKLATPPQRQRHYVCAGCGTPKLDHAVLRKKIEKQGARAKVICDRCDGEIMLWDDLEREFADEELKGAVLLVEKNGVIVLDAVRKGDLLVGEVANRIGSANQIPIEIPATADYGVDMELVFTTQSNVKTGKRVYLQLKAGSSYLRTRKTKGGEVFYIREQRWVKFWLSHDAPVFLVIGTFLPRQKGGSNRVKQEFESVRWMEIKEVLWQASEGGTKEVKSIDFKGVEMTIESILAWRDKLVVEKCWFGSPTSSVN